MTVRRTLIIATIGPRSRTMAVQRRMLEAGMDVARLNFSHGTAAEHRRLIRSLRRAFGEAGKPERIIADLPGPKIRIGDLEKNPTLLKKGSRVRLTVRDIPGTARILPVHYPRLTDSLGKGSRVFLADGFMQLVVLDVPREGEAVCEVVAGGELFSRKGFSIPGAPMWVDAVTEADLEWARFGLSQGLDSFGVSFAAHPAEIARLRAFGAGLGKKLRVIAKIERQEALSAFPALLEASDGIMVARGDLGLQLPLEEIPFIQKDLLRRCRRAGRTGITATQMMESMMHSPRPARSDVADVANAVLDGTSAVMLSEETAMGDYPVETIAWMERVAAAAERHLESGSAPPPPWLGQALNRVTDAGERNL